MKAEVSPALIIGHDQHHIGSGTDGSGEPSQQQPERNQGPAACRDSHQEALPTGRESGDGWCYRFSGLSRQRRSQQDHSPRSSQSSEDGAVFLG